LNRALIILFLIKALSAGGFLSNPFIGPKGDLPVKCGTPYRLMHKTISQTRPIMNHYFDTRHFRIWYSLAEPNKPDTTDINPHDGVPDYVNRVAEVMEFCYAMEVNTFGYAPPIPDSTADSPRRNVGGDDRIDVYIQELWGNYFGETLEDEPLQTAPSKAPGFIIIDNDYIGYGYDENPLQALQVTCAHELFHLIQFGYDYLEDIWWMEATAVFMEEQVYPLVNDYINYLGDFLMHPELSLTYASGMDNHMYGACLFPMFLAKMYGWRIVREIWELCGEPGISSIPAISQSLERHNTTLREAFGTFALWNLFTADRADTANFYREGHLYPSVAIKDTLDLLHVPADTVSDSLHSSLSCVYVGLPRSKTPVGLEQIRFGFSANSGDWLFGAAGFPPANSDWKDTLIRSSRGLFPWSFRYNLLIFCAPLVSEGGQFSLVVERSAQTLQIADSVFSPYPNPVVHGSEAVYFPLFLSQGGDVMLSIYSPSGELIFESTFYNKPPGPLVSKKNAIRWELNNPHNKTVANGIYIYKIRTPQKTVHGKIGVLR